MFTTEPELAAYLDQREEAKHSRLLLNPSFTATVTGVQGAAGAYQVQIQRTGDRGKDETWYEVEANGTVPTIGARISLRWRDQNLATAVSVIGTPPRVVDQHNWYASYYWTGSFTLSAGWNPIGYSNAIGDPSGIYDSVSGLWTIPISGTWLLTMRSGANVSGDVACAIYKNGSEFVRGSELNPSSSVNSSTLAAQRPLLKGDQLKGYIFSGVGTLRSGSNENYMDIYLLRAD